MKLNYLAKKYLKSQISGYVSKDQNACDLSTYLRLDLGENLLGCSPKVLSCLKDVTVDDLRYYADPGSRVIKKVISGLHGIQTGNITIANSSNEIIDYIPMMILEPNDKVLVITPTFFRYIESSLSAGGSIVSLLLYENDYQYSDSIITKIITYVHRYNVKLIWLCNPNNPTGTVLELKHIEQIIAKSNAFVVLDEAFYEYYDLTNNNSGIHLLDRYQNLIVLRTLSKAYGLAGLRLGYALGHKNVIETIERYRNTLLMTSSLVQKIAITALLDHQWLRQTVSKTRILRDQIIHELHKISGIQTIHGSEANIYLLRHTTKDIFEELKKEGILAADFRQSQGLEGQGYVRLTVGNKQDNTTLIRAIKKL